MTLYGVPALVCITVCACRITVYVSVCLHILVVCVLISFSSFFFFFKQGFLQHFVTIALIIKT